MSPELGWESFGSIPFFKYARRCKYIMFHCWLSLPGDVNKKLGAMAGGSGNVSGEQIITAGLGLRSCSPSELTRLSSKNFSQTSQTSPAGDRFLYSPKIMICAAFRGRVSRRSRLTSERVTQNLTCIGVWGNLTNSIRSEVMMD